MPSFFIEKKNKKGIVMKKYMIKRGITLMETVLALVIGLAVIGGALVYFGQSQDTKQAGEIKEELTAINGIVHQLYVGTTSYQGLSSQTLTNSGLLPSKYVNGDNIVTPNRQTIQVFATTPNGNGYTGYIVVIFNVSKSVCANLVTTEWANIINYQINGSNIGSGPGSANQTKLCNDGPNNNMGWTFN